MAGFEKHQSEGAHGFVLVTDDSEKPPKGSSEKLVCVIIEIYVSYSSRRFSAILE